MNLLFIVNPIAGKGSTTEAIPVIQSYCLEKQISCKILKTQHPGHATEIARSEANSDFDGIVVVGGDGTILEAANGLVGTSMPLGVIPLGSGNDFAKILKMPMGFQNISKALDIITTSIPKPIDIVKFDGRYFLNIGSVGFDAEIIRDLHKIRRFVKGSAAYVISVLVKFLTYKVKDATIIIDGKRIDTRIFLAAICNGTCYGGGMKVNPNGKVDDGYLDLILIKPVPRYKVPLLLNKFRKGEHLNLPYVETYHCKNVQIISKQKLVVNVDGECADTTPIDFNIIPLAFNVLGSI